MRMHGLAVGLRGLPDPFLLPRFQVAENGLTRCNGVHITQGSLKISEFQGTRSLPAPVQSESLTAVLVFARVFPCCEMASSDFIATQQSTYPDLAAAYGNLDELLSKKCAQERLGSR